MSLSSELISAFVKITNDTKKQNTETTVYGTIVKDNGVTYVKLDGSDILTPVCTTADANDGERVTVLIKNHTATVTGNVTSPAARTGDVQELGNDVNDLNEDNIVINRKLTAKLDASTAEVTYAKISDLDAMNVEIEKLRAAHENFLSAAEGTSGIWSYTKWSNGRVELWGSYIVSGVVCDSQFGSAMYRSDVLTIPSFPFSIYDPILTASYESSGYGAFLWATSSTTENSPPSYYLVRIESGTINSGKINFHVIGKLTE